MGVPGIPSRSVPKDVASNFVENPMDPSVIDAQRHNVMYDPQHEAGQKNHSAANHSAANDRQVNLTILYFGIPILVFLLIWLAIRGRRRVMETAALKNVSMSLSSLMHTISSPPNSSHDSSYSGSEGGGFGGSTGSDRRNPVTKVLDIFSRHHHHSRTSSDNPHISSPILGASYPPPHYPQRKTTGVHILLTKATFGSSKRRDLARALRGHVWYSHSPSALSSDANACKFPMTEAPCP
ncbi:unnamed protein product [Cyprideis torosa]|uniref:Uncharacterized protein n=1 Tax=Cyprideis torosa TaxID=163714 RepID=A0A7R8ZL10_9CRUS|nr:unnamed protein product [Cyprideis torosa]CAG0881404.1 unnamed protein product [Cyprideis torosa]